MLQGNPQLPRTDRSNTLNGVEVEIEVQDAAPINPGMGGMGMIDLSDMGKAFRINTKRRKLVPEAWDKW
jgi:hypothetical protein